MNQPKCSVSFEDLLLWRDGEMPRLRRALLSRHIERCARCRQEISLMDKIAHELREDEADSPQPMPAPLRERILSALPPEPAAPAAASPSASTSTAKSASAAPATAHRIRPRSRWVERGALAGAGALAMLVAVSAWGPRAPGAFSGVPDTLASSQSEGSAGEPPSASTSGDAAGATAASSAEAASRVASSAGPVFQNQVEFKSGLKSNAADARSLTIGGNGAASLYADGHVMAQRRGAEPQFSQRQVHKDASIGVGVADAEEGAASVESLAKGVGGFVATTTVSTGSNGLRSANMSLRVPVKRFEDVMSQVGRMGRLLSKSVSGEDITARLSDEAKRRQVLAADLNAQETVLKAALARQDAARRRAEEAGRSRTAFEVPWEDRARVRNLRASAAQSRARLESLRQAAEMSDIEVELRERRSAAGQAGFAQEMRLTMSQALTSFAVALRAPFNLLIWIAAFAPLWLPAILFYRFAMKRASQEPPSQPVAPDPAYYEGEE